MSDSLGAIRARINEVCRAVFGGNEAEMARSIDWNRPTLHRILNGSTKKIDSALLDAIVQYGVSRSWLMDGGGSMMRQEDKETSQVLGRIMELIDRFDQKIDKLDGDAAGTEARMLLMAIAKEIRPLAEGDQDLLDEIDHVEKNIIANAFR